MVKYIYICKPCDFEYVFPKGTFKGIHKKALKELKKCPKCNTKMEVKKCKQ